MAGPRLCETGRRRLLEPSVSLWVCAARDRPLLADSRHGRHQHFGQPVPVISPIGARATAHGDGLRPFCRVERELAALTSGIPPSAMPRHPTTYRWPERAPLSVKRAAHASNVRMGRCQASPGRRARRVQTVRPSCGRVVTVGGHLIMRSWPNTALTPECIERYG
jgi:hypothetical protein